MISNDFPETVHGLGDSISDLVTSFQTYGSYTRHWTGNGTGTGTGMDTKENNDSPSLSLFLCSVYSA